MALTLVVILALAALILAIASAAGRWNPLAMPVAVVLLALAMLVQRVPTG